MTSVKEWAERRSDRLNGACYYSARHGYTGYYKDIDGDGCEDRIITDVLINMRLHNSKQWLIKNESQIKQTKNSFTYRKWNEF